jgi:glycine/D-amino acid oxidase-like deaminating enzyme
MISFWEQQTFLNYDIIIVGSGIVGLSAACSILEKNPSAKVLILERGIFPTGASTKNAGFACYGSASELLEDIKLMGESKTLQLVQMRKAGLDMLRHRLSDHAIDYLEYGGGEFIFKNELFNVNALEGLNNMLLPIFGKNVFEMDANKGAHHGFNTQEVSHFIENKVEGQIDPGKMMDSLIKYATALGCKIITGCEVVEFDDAGTHVLIGANHHVLSETIYFKAQQCIVCTNAFTPNLVKPIDIKPGRGQVLATKPIKNLPFKGIFHFSHGYYYFRNFGNRIIFGGGRNMDFDKEASDEFKLNTEIQERLDYYLKNLIIPQIDYEVETRWAGIMAFGSQKLPIVEYISANVIIACRMSGMGIALGSWVGQEVYRLLNEKQVV